MLSFMTLKSDSKFKEKLTCGFKYDMINLENFHPITQKSENFTPMGSFFLGYLRFQLKKYRGVIFHDTEQWCEIWINPDLVILKRAWRIWWNFIKGLKSPEKKYIDGLFLSTAYNVSARKFQKNYMSRHWKVMQNLKENWLLVPKMMWGIWRISMRVVASLKNCTLMCYFCQ